MDFSEAIFLLTKPDVIIPYMEQCLELIVCVQDPKISLQGTLLINVYNILLSTGKVLIFYLIIVGHSRTKYDVYLYNNIWQRNNILVKKQLTRIKIEYKFHNLYCFQKILKPNI